MRSVPLPLRPTVLVLVQGAAESGDVQRALRAQRAIPIAVRPGGVVPALSYYRPTAVVVDVAHMATAPDDFFAAADAAQVDVICIGARGERAVASPLMPVAPATPPRASVAR